MNILVGEVPLLERPFMAFIRFAKPLSGIAEVPIGTRFICLYLEPPSSQAPPPSISTAAASLGGAISANGNEGQSGRAIDKSASANAGNGSSSDRVAGPGAGAAGDGKKIKSKSTPSLTSNENAVVVPTSHAREMGRCFGTLMSDEIFQIIAYRARDREDLIAGFDEFLQNAMILPPGEWDPTIRIDPPKSLPSQVHSL